jgi:hypothetical protein
MDFDALHRGESTGEGIPPMTTPQWDHKAPKENVIGWQAGGWCTATSSTLASASATTPSTWPRAETR